MVGLDPDKVKNKKQINNQEEDTTESSSSVKESSSKGKSKSGIIIGCVVAVVIVGGLAYFLTMRNDSQKNTQPASSTQTKTTAKSSTSTDTDDKVKAGVPNLNSDTTDRNTAKLNAVPEFLKDLSNKDIAVDYKIKRIKTVTDFINYEKKRASTGDGIELYWLEATYKDRPYKVQVPFQIWKELDTKGITVVDVEVLQLGTDSEVVSYMSVRSDYKKLLEKRDK